MDLQEAGFRGSIEAGVPLAPLTTWRIGGPAELLATPVDADDLQRAVRWARARGVPWRILGNGSNLLVRDEGVPGIVLRVRRCLDRVEIDGELVVAGAGAMFPALSRATAAAGLGGLEFGAGIPGTVGGALIMNAGWHEYEIGNFVEWVDALDTQGDRCRFSREECGFRYRGSALRDERRVVLAAGLHLHRGATPQIEARLEAFADSRKRHQPTEHATCGSVFVQPPGDFAGRLIEAAGLKGARVGAIEVSTLHANFFINHGGGTAADVLRLVERVEAEVAERFGVRLEREFELW